MCLIIAPRAGLIKAGMSATRSKPYVVFFFISVSVTPSHTISALFMAFAFLGYTRIGVGLKDQNGKFSKLIDS
jgi:Sec-independent protein secretion pathway component TatC